MLLVMSKNATDKEIEDVIGAIKGQGYIPRPIPGGERMSIGILYNKGPVDGSLFLGMPGVQDAIPVVIDAFRNLEFIDRRPMVCSRPLWL